VTIRVLVVDDEALLRTAFSALIDAEDDLDVVGAAADGRQAVELAASLTPDVVVMDVRMPVMDGIEATKKINDAERAGCVPRVLILTTFDLDEYVFNALRPVRAASPSRAAPSRNCWPRSAPSPPARRCWPQRDPPAHRPLHRRHPGSPASAARPGGAHRARA
jgi:CheY-like chemotaxis protein